MIITPGDRGTELGLRPALIFSLPPLPVIRQGLFNFDGQQPDAERGARPVSAECAFLQYPDSTPSIRLIPKEVSFILGNTGEPMKPVPTITILCILLSAAVPAARAEFYQYTDRNGNVVISDRPPADGEGTKKELKNDRLFWSNTSVPDFPPDRSPGRAPEAPKQERIDYSRTTAIMYMTDWCGYCRKAKQYIRSLGAGLIEYNIDRDPGRKAEMREKSGGSTGVPLIDIDGTIIRGYSRPAIKAALDRSARR